MQGYHHGPRFVWSRVIRFPSSRRLPSLCCRGLAVLGLWRDRLPRSRGACSCVFVRVCVCVCACSPEFGEVFRSLCPFSLPSRILRRSSLGSVFSGLLAHVAAAGSPREVHPLNSTHLKTPRVCVCAVAPLSPCRVTIMARVLCGPGLSGSPPAGDSQVSAAEVWPSWVCGGTGSPGLAVRVRACLCVLVCVRAPR